VANPALAVEAGTTAQVPLGGGVSAWVVRGNEPGPVLWLWAPGGDADPSMAQALGELRDRLDPQRLAGAVGLLIDGPAPPLPREQYSFAPMVRAICDGAAGVIFCTSLPAGFESAPHIALDLGDRAARKLAHAMGAAFVAPPAVTPRVELPAPSLSWIDGEAERLSRPVVTRTAAALRSLLGHLEITDDLPEQPAVRVVLKSVVTVDAPGAGMVEPAVAPGGLVRAGEPAAWFGEPGLLRRRALPAPSTGVVLFVRSGRVTPGPVIGIGKLQRALPKLASASEPPSLEVGWCERVELPEWGLRLKAKIDTGARTSAVHVAAMKRVSPSVLDVFIPVARGRTSKHRVEVLEWTQVRDSGGHAEKRPVVETLLKLGPVTRKVRVSLTDRGDMKFPMLVGRTALGPEARVHPTRRFLLS
jgi:hypothetical protein